MSEIDVISPPAWLIQLDAKVAGLVGTLKDARAAADEVATCLHALTDKMAIEAGYASAEDLLSRRYAGQFKPVAAQARESLRQAGFSQSATALMCGTTRKAIESAEARDRKKDQAPLVRGDKDHQDEPICRIRIRGVDLAELRRASAVQIEAADNPSDAVVLLHPGEVMPECLDNVRKARQCFAEGNLAGIAALACSKLALEELAKAYEQHPDAYRELAQRRDYYMAKILEDVVMELIAPPMAIGNDGHLGRLRGILTDAIDRIDDMRESENKAP